MKMITRLFALGLLASILSGCGFLLFILEDPAPAVEMNYTWWNNLLNVPVIEGTINNSGSSMVSEVRIEVQTFNRNGECLYSGCITIDQYIDPYECHPFKEWITASDKACELRARVISVR